MAQCYVVKEELDFYTEYIEELQPERVPINRNSQRDNDHGIGLHAMKKVEQLDLLKAHLYELENTMEIQEYIDYVS